MRAMFVPVFLFTACACSTEEPAVEEQPEASPALTRPQEVVVYSSVAAAQINPTLEAFTAETGIKVQLFADEYSKLADKIENHGRDPIADLFVAANLTELSSAAENDILRPVYLDSANFPAAKNLLDPEKLWYPLGFRARIVVYNTRLVNEDELSTVTDYASLSDKSWGERLCLSSSKIGGNRSLIASLIREHGERDAELIVRGWRANIAGKFFIDDVELLRAVSAGECQIAIADTSVLAAAVGAGRPAALAAHRFPDDVSVLVDISGAGVTRHARNPDGASALLQWLGSEQPNALFAASGLEFPANVSAPAIASIAPWSDFVVSPMQVSQLSFVQEEAALLAERARYP